MGEERERGDGSVWVCERESRGGERGERESRGWERESRVWERGDGVGRIESREDGE